MLSLSDCRPGALVECIAATPELTLGALYTIEAARFGDRTDESASDWGVQLRDLAPPRGYAGFDRSRFRVVPEGRLDVFRAMLDVREDA